MKKCNLYIIFSSVFIIIFLLSCKRSIPDSALINSPSILQNNSSFEIINQFMETGSKIETNTKPEIENKQVSKNDTNYIIDENGIVWIIEPKLEYKSVFYCVCGYTANTFEYNIDEYTGQIVSEHYGHGGLQVREWLYDIETRMFGIHSYGWEEEVIIHPLDQFLIYFSSYATNLGYVRQIASKDIIRNDNEWGASFNLGEKYINSKYAISYGGTILTDFIYDRAGNISDSLTYKNAIPVSLDGKWGFINSKGNIIIPFIFEHAESSNGETAFVKINGKYGIIDVHNSTYH